MRDLRYILYPFDATRLASVNSCLENETLIEVQTIDRAGTLDNVIMFVDLRPLVPPVHNVGVLVVEVLPDRSKDVVPHGVRGSFGSLGNEANGIAEEQLQIDEVGDLEKRMQ